MGNSIFSFGFARVSEVRHLHLRRNGNTAGYTKIQKSGDKIGSMKPEKCQWRMYIEKLDAQPPAGLIFFIFRRNWPNNRLTPLLFGLAPPLGNPGSDPECA